MNMATIRVTLSAKRPGTLLNPMSQDQLLRIRTKNYKQQNRDWTPDEEAESKLLRNADGRLMLPISYLLACLVRAGRKVKMGPMLKVSNATSTELFSFFETDQEELVLSKPGTDEDPNWETDIRRGIGKNGAVPTAVCIVRPLIKEWETQVTFQVDRDVLSDLKIMEEVFMHAGRVGMGDFRSSCKGPFGQFTVEKWEVLDSGQEVKASATAKKGRGRAKAAASNGDEVLEEIEA